MKPNFIVIMTDDQGYGDLSCMGNTDFVTPHIDALAQRGTRFTNFYSNSPVCSPSRASLLTGKYPAGTGVRGILQGKRHTTGLTAKTPTFASALGQQGYHTGTVGKWHLGLAHDSRPNQNGFDYFYGFMAGCIDYYSHVFYWGMSDGVTNPTHDLWENNNEIHRDGEYFTELVTDQAVDYIRKHKEAPFALYVAYNAPHYPMHAPQKYKDRFAHLPWDRQIMAAMISAVDDGVGDIVDELERQGLLENTCIIYQSDNGPSRESRNWMDGNPDPYYGGTSGGFKGYKSSLFEGGIRVPGIISYPNALPQGQVLDTPVVSMDFFPTMLDLAGIGHSDYSLDGVSMLPVLQGRTKDCQHEMIFWELWGQLAARWGDYKLVLKGGLHEEKEPIQVPKIFLSQLKDDFSEETNLADALPEVRDRMMTAAIAWYEKATGEEYSLDQ